MVQWYNALKQCHPYQNQLNVTLLRQILQSNRINSRKWLFCDNKNGNKSLICHLTEPLLQPKEPQQENFRIPYEDWQSEDRPVDGDELLFAFLRLSDSSGSTPLLDPRFSPSSPPAVRSNQQGRGMWVDMLGAGRMFRLVVSNVNTEAPPLPPQHTHDTHTQIPHFYEGTGHG